MRIAICSLVLAMLAVGSIGCSSKPKPDNVSFKAIRHDLTPELNGLAERKVDIQRNMAVVNNQNSRMFSDDLGGVFYTDRPSRLSPLPVMATSGNPR